MEFILQALQLNFTQRLAVLSNSDVTLTLKGIRHGIEREALRIQPNGSLAQTPHNKKIGAALTHEYITTDFSESLLEFITPPETDPDKTLGQLRDLHKFTVENIADERLWPMSMPCYINSEEQIPIAQFGQSNTGRMKSLYRTGLKNRYGSMMQAIAGVHFNFSLPDEFWQTWLPQSQGTPVNKDTISAAYFSMIRNYRRFCWLIPYLYGASPALCQSFIAGKATTLPFKKIGKGTLYLPYATSLRMSDLGYTNSDQSGLGICYNKVDSYIESLRGAINTPSHAFQKFAGKKDGKYQQLNSNVLQIENELYSPIRPKQPTRPLEKPTDALDERGVSYIEVRALDVNPFSEIGIERNQFFFLDVFLLYCLVTPSAQMTPDSFQETEDNLRAVVEHGRDPALTLSDSAEVKPMSQWAQELFSGLREIAKIMDRNTLKPEFTQAVETEWQKIVDPDLTPSAKILSILLSDEKDNGVLGIELAEQYKLEFSKLDYQYIDGPMLVQQANESLSKQAELEQADTISFDDFLADYFVYDLASSGQS
ncbi:MAG: glutamate--cysteine ligase [Paraglaciecola sp.]